MSNFQEIYQSVISQLQRLQNLYVSTNPVAPDTPPDSPLVLKANLDAVTAELEQNRQDFQAQLEEVRANLTSAENNVSEFERKRQECKGKIKEERALRSAAAIAGEEDVVSNLRKSIKILEGMIREYESDIDNLEAEIRLLRKRESDIVRDAEESLKAQLKQAQELVREFGEEKQAMLAAHHQELVRLGNRATSQVEEEREKHRTVESELQKIRAGAEKRDKEAQVNFKLLQDQLSKARQDNVAARSREAELQKSLKSTQFEEESNRHKFDQRIASMKKDNDEILAKMKAEHNQKISSMQTHIRATVAELEAKHNQTITSMKFEQSQTVAMLNKDHARTITNMKTEHERAIADLKNEHNRELADLDSKLEKFSIAAGKNWEFRRNKGSYETPVRVVMSVVGTRLRFG